MDWFLYDNGPRHERLKQQWKYKGSRHKINSFLDKIPIDS